MRKAAVGAVAALLLVVVALALLVMSTPNPVERPSSTPSATVTPSAVIAPVSPTVAVSQAGLDRMEPNSVWVPEVNLYAPLEPMGLVEGTYRGEKVMQIQLPSDPKRAMWFADGGAPCGTQGTILVAGHVRNKGVNGELLKLNALRPNGGAVAVVKCSDGQWQAWKLVRTEVLDKFEWPDEVMTGTGPRRLVLSTCTGTVVDGHYTDNILQHFEPVSLSAVTVAP